MNVYRAFVISINYYLRDVVWQMQKLRPRLSGRLESKLASLHSWVH